MSNPFDRGCIEEVESATAVAAQHDQTIKIRQSQSLVPPTVVKQTRTHVTFSWRATRGPCSIRTERRVNSISHDDEWADLEKDIKRDEENAVIKASQRIKRGRNRTTERKNTGTETTRVISKAEVLEIDHVELQTCSCGCPRCVPGRGEAEEEQPTTQIATTGRDDSNSNGHRECSLCLRCAKKGGEVTTTRGVGCWRPVYWGNERCCKVKLEHRNALQHFRLLVRARKPPPGRRNYLRPTGRELHSPPLSAETNNRPSPHGVISSRAAGAIIPRREKPSRTVLYNNVIDSCNAGSQTISTGPQGGHIDHSSGHPQAAVDAAVLHRNVNSTSLSDNEEPPRWFVSAPVFINTHPPPVKLHGLGTTLVITWPSLTSFSGSECVSYVLEQRSRPVRSARSVNGTTADIFHSRQLNHLPTASAGGVGDGGLRGSSHCAQNKVGKRRDCVTRQHPCPGNKNSKRRHCRHAAHQNESKQVFSVGTRCWFVPTSLAPGHLYRYRLRLVHEGEWSIAGQWVSHMTTVPPPRCIGAAGAQGVVISLPKISSTRSGASRDDGTRGEGVYSRGVPEVTADLGTEAFSQGEIDLARAKDSSGGEYTDGASSEDDGEAPKDEENPLTSPTHSPCGSEAFSREGGEEKSHQAGDVPQEMEEMGTPVVWYRLTGSDMPNRWRVVYEGPSSQVAVQGLEPNALFSFRVTVDVDLTELRRRALSSLTSLGLEAPPNSVLSTPSALIGSCSPTHNGKDTIADTTILKDATRSETGPILAASTANTRHGSGRAQSWRWTVDDSAPSPKSIVVQPAARKGTVGGAGPGASSGSALSAVQSGISSPKNTGLNGSFCAQRQRIRSWSPATSPVMSQLKKEGFAIHDVAFATDSGYFPEPPARSSRRWGDTKNRLGTSEYEPLDRSDPAVFATAPRAPFFTSFVLDGICQVKVWWAPPQQIVDIHGERACPSTAHVISNTTEATVTAMPASDLAMAKDGCKRQSGTTNMGSSKRSTHSTPKGHDARGTVSTAHLSPLSQQQQQQQQQQLRQKQQYPVYVLQAFDPVSGDARPLYSGTDRWTDLPQIFANLPIAPATAYFLTLSAKVSAEQAESKASGVIFTAPPAPVLELVGGGVVPPLARTFQGEANVTGEDSPVGVRLRAFWVDTFDTMFLPAEEKQGSHKETDVHLPPISVALEMSRAWTAGPPDRGAGGIMAGTIPRSGPTGLSGAHPSRELDLKRLGTVGGGRTQRGRSLLPGNAKKGESGKLANSEDNSGIVKGDAGGGLCWTLDSSTWDRPPGGTTAGGFRDVWRGFDGETEAFTPSLPPGVRVAFRVRVDCRFGVAYSAATVYQTASVVPPPPTGLRASVTTHESRVGKTSSCLCLTWDLAAPGHGRNIATSFTVQARRCGSNTTEQSWHNVCTCPAPPCVDPNTLGTPRVAAHYRVRGHGPGGSGDWCKPLPVDLLVAGESLDVDTAGDGCTISVIPKEGSVVTMDDKIMVADSSKKYCGRSPMPYRASGSRERDSLTGEVRRAWHARGKLMKRPLQMHPPSAAVAAAVSGAPISAAIHLKYSPSDYRHRRAGGSKQLLWGMLASPRESRMCRAAAAMKRGERGAGRSGGCVGRDIPTCMGIRPLQLGCSGDGAIENGLDGVKGAGGEDARSDWQASMRVVDGSGSSAQQPCGYQRLGKMSSNAMPQALALVLREQLDISPSSAIPGFAALSDTMEKERGRHLVDGETSVPGPDG